MKKNLLFFITSLLMSVFFVSCVRQNTPIFVYYEFYNDTEHIIEIKNYYGNGQVDYYKINPNEYLFVEKNTILPDSPKKKPNDLMDYIDIDLISPFKSVSGEGFVEVIFDGEHTSYHFLKRFNFELPEWYEDGKYYVSTDARSLANKDAYTFELRKRKKRKSDFRYDAYYRFTEADYLEAVND